jgi:O-6-methylguanine DNA methyltransferase
MTLPRVGGFAARVLSIVGRIPPGRVMTYGDVAKAAGRPSSARAVGRIMAVAAVPGLPYHRVIAAGGLLGGYGGLGTLKTSLLLAEGVVVRRGRVVDFAKRRWGAPGVQRSTRSCPSKDDE